VKEACRAGARILSAPGILRQTLLRAVFIDYLEQREKMEKFLRIIKGKERVRIKTGKGTNISFSVKGRSWHMDDGMPQRGSFSNLPAGELFIAPIEGVAEGVVFCRLICGRCKGCNEIHLTLSYLFNLCEEERR
jgi:leucyl aminopeptidase (aminopeptidase T)